MNMTSRRNRVRHQRALWRVHPYLAGGTMLFEYIYRWTFSRRMIRNTSFKIVSSTSKISLSLIIYVLLISITSRMQR
ncbi:hypothetical protein ASPWEDRAFT_710156 [Aspergillus wentii DTO 134E9]|uniref:Uncharacterized protein n=1 Tax=Aspergillus wentii DTO 134E9 TaxID=1073089 RepID=A0A1L9R644_ASPWE|nr:uncharacterized protein ASPWEDRAFT_710156 [Aspergillus wentii DTO 134E9]OJJ30392.1 hypothetical protein ASPWEDRAFT_710156 [Aspergillus wentii DTO 134E9]